MNCIIIDDEPLALKLIESYVKKTEFLTLVGKFNSAIQAMKKMKIDDVDLIFLDIQMPELNGIDFAKNINPKCEIIFITAFQQYAIDSFKVNVVDYLLKPVSYNNFLKAAKKAYNLYELMKHSQDIQYQTNEVATHDLGQQSEQIEENTNDSFFIKSGHKVIHLYYNDINYIESIKDYAKIYTKNDEYPIVTLTTMKALEEKLPHNMFMRVHRSYIIRKDCIKLIEHNNIILGDVYVPISLTHRNEVKKFLGIK
jgi:DNA-binding LytR/AlgR family response regulator